MIFTIPVDIRSANQIAGGNRFKLASIAKDERRTVYFAAHSAGIRAWRRQNHAPYLVTLTRVLGPYRRKYDEGDNDRAGWKHIRDEVAALLGLDDGPDAPITWVYKQRKGERTEAEIRIDTSR